MQATVAEKQAKNCFDQSTTLLAIDQKDEEQHTSEIMSSPSCGRNATTCAEVTPNV